MSHINLPIHPNKFSKQLLLILKSGKSIKVFLTLHLTQAQLLYV